MIDMYAYAPASADESDPDELFNVEAADPAAVMKQHFPNARLTFKHEDEGQFVYDVVEGDDTIAVLYASEDITPTPAKATTKAASAKAPNSGLTTRDVAERVGTTPQRLRVFLRSQGDRFNPPGSGGGRYTFVAKDVSGIKAAFKKWEAELIADKKAKDDVK